MFFLNGFYKKKIRNKASKIKAVENVEEK